MHLRWGRIALMPLDRAQLLALYDEPDPQAPGRLIPGYDKAHADRTARIVALVARRLWIGGEILEKLEVATLLHDIGRVGLEPKLFGLIFESAQERGLPVRVGDLVRRYPGVRKDEASQLFVELVRPVLVEKGIAVDRRVREHIDMRMAFDQRVRRVLGEREPELRRLGVIVEPWMEQVMLYYYYPELSEGAPEGVRLMGMILVACENLEAYNNIQRGRDYYGRKRESLQGAFAVLRRFLEEGLISIQVYDALSDLTEKGELRSILNESRGLPPETPLPEEDCAFLEELRREQQTG